MFAIQTQDTCKPLHIVMNRLFLAAMHRQVRLRTACKPGQRGGLAAGHLVLSNGRGCVPLSAGPESAKDNAADFCRQVRMCHSDLFVLDANLVFFPSRQSKPQQGAEAVF